MRYQKLDLVQGSPEWRETRLEHFTASHAGVIDNVYPYKTALEYATEILTKKEKDESEDKQVIFQRGHAVEKGAREWVRSNLNIEFLPMVVVSEDVRCLLASLDGGAEEIETGFEAKYVGREALAEVKKGILKPHHEYQVQAQLLATGWKRFIYFAMDPDGEAAVLDVAPKPELQARLKEGIQQFWDNLKAGKLPEACDKDVIKVDDPELGALVDLDIQLADLTRKYEEKREAVLKKYAEAVRVQGNGVSIVKYWQSGNVDYSKVPQLKGVDLDRFRKAGALRTKITIKRGA